jgi:hypothetical protein
MASAAWNGAIRVDGTPTAFSNASCAKVTANTVYRMSTYSGGLIDPTQAVTVEVDADGAGGGGYVVASPSTYTLDYLFGTVTFAADQGANALVRMSGYYLPLVTLAGVTEYNYSTKTDILETTEINTAGGAKTKLAGLKDMSGSIKLHTLDSYDHDAGAGTKKLKDYYDNGTPMLFERQAAGKLFRAWVLLESNEADGGVAGLIGTSLGMTGAPRGQGAAYAWEP